MDLFFSIRGHSMGSLCGSGPQGFRQLTKHILLLLCCPPTMLFTYRRTSESVQQMNEKAWLSFTEPLHRKSWSEPLTVIMSKLVIYDWCKLSLAASKSTEYITLKARKSENDELTIMKLFLGWKLLHHIFYHALHTVPNLVRQLLLLI